MRYVKISTMLIVSFVMVVSLVTTTRAAVFNVTNPAELQSALTAAQANGEDDTINLAAGTYNVTALLSFSSTEAFDITISGAGAASTFLDGGGATAIMELSNTGAISVENIRFQDSNSSFISALNIYNSGNVTITGCTFANNNIGSQAQGAAVDIYFNTSAPPGQTVSVIGNTFSSNSALGRGAISLASNTIDDVNFVLRGNSFDTNSGGGAYVNLHGGTITVDDNLFAGNSSSQPALEIGSFGSSGTTLQMTVVNNVFTGNNANQGGALVVTASAADAATLNITNNTFAENDGTTQPQGNTAYIGLDGPNKQLNVYNNIFFHQAGIFSDDLLYINDDNDLNGSVATVAIFNNDFFNGTRPTYAVRVGTSTTQGSNISQDPLFTDTSSSDPAVWDLHLTGGSPAINTGSNSAPGLPATDYDGDSRIINTTVDMGADEVTSGNAPEINVTPVSVNFPDTVSGNSSSPQEVTIANTGSADLVVSDIALATGTDYSLNLSGGTTPCGSATPTVASGADCTVTVTFNPQSVATGIADTLSISSNDSDEATVNVPLTGNGVAAPAPEIDVTPVTVNFTDTVVGNSSSPQEVTIANTGSADLVVSDIALATGTDYSLNLSGGTTPCGSATPTVASGGNCTVTVTFSPQSVATGIADTLSISSNDSDEATVNVPLTGNGTPAPAPNISLSPTSLDFGDVASGSSSNPKQVIISNTGNLSLAVSGITLSTPSAGEIHIDLGADPCGSLTPAIAAGDSCEIFVMILPSSVASYSETLTVASNDPDTPNADVSLSGNGVTDTDGDGVPDSVETPPNDTDSTMANLPAAKGTGDIVIDGKGLNLSEVKVISDDDPVFAGDVKPSGFQFDSGLVYFELAVGSAGDSAMVDITYPSIPSGSKCFKVDDTGFNEFPSPGAEFNGNVLTLSLTDGVMPGDSDGTADATIIDPNGIGSPVSQAPSSGGGGGCSVAASGDPASSGVAIFWLLLASGLFLCGSRGRFSRKK